MPNAQEHKLDTNTWGMLESASTAMCDGGFNCYGRFIAPTCMRASSMVGTAVEPVRWWVDIEIHVLRLRLRSHLPRTSLQCDGHRLYTRWRAVASPGPRPGGTSRIRTL